jgi:hypothetical protein
MPSLELRACTEESLGKDLGKTSKSESRRRIILDNEICIDEIRTMDVVIHSRYHTLTPSNVLRFAFTIYISYLPALQANAHAHVKGPTRTATATRASTILIPAIDANELDLILPNDHLRRVLSRSCSQEIHSIPASLGEET